MPVLDTLAGALGRARYLISKLELGADARAREEARLADARRLDADEVGRRADQRRAEREDRSKG